jgi:hypothetical protein
MRLVRKVCTQHSLTLKPGSTRFLKALERHLAMNIVGPSGLWWLSRRTLVPMVWLSWFMFHVRTLLLCIIFSIRIFTCPLLWSTIILWKLWFTLGLLILSRSWMKSNESSMVVLGTSLATPWCGRRGVLEGALDTPWKWIEWNRDTKKGQRWIVNLWRIGTRFIALNATKPATTDEDVKRTYILRIWNSSLIYFWLCPFFFSLMYVVLIYLFHYAPCVIYLCIVL